MSFRSRNVHPRKKPTAICIGLKAGEKEGGRGGSNEPHR
jgi:hypothetical protein